MAAMGRIITALAPLACSFVAGCHLWAFDARTGQRPGEGVAQAHTRVSVRSGDRVLTGIVVAVMLAEGLRYYLRGEDGTMTALSDVPEPDPGRVINEQDCTAPVDTGRGNLMCR